MREPVVAGSFYPADPRALGDLVDRSLEASTGHLDERPWGIVVPHAGYRFSGPIAATAYGALRPWASRIRRVLLLGPAHFVPLTGCATTAASAWRTPLGTVEVDPQMREAVGCPVDDAPHGPEHSLEVQLPFLQRLVGPGLRIVPVAVGRGPDLQVAALLERASLDLAVVSTDLSHYLDLQAARETDRRTADAVVRREPEAIGPNDACGIFALRGVLAFARATSRRIDLLDLRTSGDTAGDPASVVGYGAFAIGGPSSPAPIG
jgi:AmmeMemoRadiSam system protein B